MSKAKQFIPIWPEARGEQIMAALREARNNMNAALSETSQITDHKQEPSLRIDPDGKMIVLTWEVRERGTSETLSPR